MSLNSQQPPSSTKTFADIVLISVGEAFNLWNISQYLMSHISFAKVLNFSFSKLKLYIGVCYEWIWYVTCLFIHCLFLYFVTFLAKLDTLLFWSSKENCNMYLFECKYTFIWSSPCFVQIVAYFLFCSRLICMMKKYENIAVKLQNDKLRISFWLSNLNKLQGLFLRFAFDPTYYLQISNTIRNT